MAPPLGTCRLCRREQPLRETHFLPAGLYPRAITRLPASAGRIAPNEVDTHLLCGECQERFNRNGESAVLRLLGPSARETPLLRRLENATPFRLLPDQLLMAVYSGRAVGIDTTSFAYFALSVAWRAAVHAWRLPDGTRSAPCDLGSHEEPIRRYLMGEAPFPAETAVVMTVCSDEASRNGWAAPAQGGGPHLGCSIYRIQVLGVVLAVWLGANIPPHVRLLCCGSSPDRPVVKADCSDAGNWAVSQRPPS
jgi:hypothetical protein